MYKDTEQQSVFEAETCSFFLHWIVVSSLNSSFKNHTCRTILTRPWTIGFKRNMHRWRSLSSKARQILLIWKSHGWVASSEIDRPTLHCCLTQLPKFQALVKMVLLNILRLTWWLLCWPLHFTYFASNYVFTLCLD